MKKVAPRQAAWAAKGSSAEAGAGMDLAANVFVGLALGWLLQKFVPSAHPWGYVGGLILGAVSGFYQLFKRFGARPRP